MYRYENCYIYIYTQKSTYIYICTLGREKKKSNRALGSTGDKRAHAVEPPSVMPRRAISNALIHSLSIRSTLIFVNCEPYNFN